jgi:hypothetical protein
MPAATTSPELMRKALALVLEAYAARGIDIAHLDVHEDFAVEQGVSHWTTPEMVRRCYYLLVDTKNKAAERVIRTARGEIVPEQFHPLYMVTFDDMPEVTHRVRAVSLFVAMREADASNATLAPLS